MNVFLSLFSVAAVLLAPGCSKSPANNIATPAGSSTAGNSGASAAPMNGTTAVIDAAMLTAHPWASAGCTVDPITFQSDGRLTGLGNEAWSWVLAGDRLTLTGPTGRPEPYVLSRRGAELVMTAEGGSYLAYSPCPAP